MIGDAGQHIGEPGARIDIAEFGRADERIHRCRPLPTAVTAGEQPGFPAKYHAAQRALSRIVGQTNAPIVEKAPNPSQRLSM